MLLGKATPAQQDESIKYVGVSVRNRGVMPQARGRYAPSYPTCNIADHSFTFTHRWSSWPAWFCLAKLHIFSKQ